MANNDVLQQEFDIWVEKHPEIWTSFCSWADKLIARGLMNSSATMIIEAVKMEHALRTGENLPIPNNHRSYFAKKWLETHKPPKYPWRFFRKASAREIEIGKLASIEVVMIPVDKIAEE